MKAEDLNKTHYKIWEKNPEISQSKEHTKLSIQFAIEVLEAHLSYKGKKNVYEFGWNKIQELKQYLDEKV